MEIKYLSVSQIKKANADMGSWFADKFLWLWNAIEEETNFAVGDLVENYLITGEDNFDIIKDRNIADMDRLKEIYESAKHNAEWLEFEKWEQQVKVSGKLFDIEFVWYVDNLTDEYVDDIKTCWTLTKNDATFPNSWSGMTTYREYEVQLWVYMKLLGRKKGRIIEVAKHSYKDKDRHEHQMLEFNMTDKWDKEMKSFVGTIIDKMKDTVKVWFVNMENLFKNDK